MLLVIFLTGCGSGKPPGCCSIYETDDAVARELLGWPSGWEEVCEQMRAGNDIFGGRRYFKGFCFAPDYDDTSRQRAGGADLYGPTCAQCERDGRVFGGRRIWVPCDEKTVRCPEPPEPRYDEHYCPPLTTDYDCPWYDELLGTCSTPVDCCYRVPDWSRPPRDEEGRLYLWQCCYEQPDRSPRNGGCGSDSPERCNWPPPWFEGGVDEFHSEHNIVPDPFCDTLREWAARGRPELRDED